MYYLPTLDNDPFICAKERTCVFLVSELLLLGEPNKNSFCRDINQKVFSQIIIIHNTGLNFLKIYYSIENLRMKFYTVKLKLLHIVLQDLIPTENIYE